MTRWRVAPVALLCCALGWEAAAAQTGPAAHPLETASPSWGTSAESLLSVNAFSFDTTGNAETFLTNSGYARFSTGGAGQWIAGVNLPTGAVVTGIEVQGCDGSGFGYLQITFLRQIITGGSEAAQPLGLLATGAAATPGCGNFAATITPVTIDNANAGYVLDVQQGFDFSGSVNFQTVRLRYKLQVSPAPATATFGDVPTTSPQFKFVEALVAAGITAGCGGGNYCPNDPITRGQMAVFLASALGMHWPN